MTNIRKTNTPQPVEGGNRVEGYFYCSTPPAKRQEDQVEISD